MTHKPKQEGAPPETPRVGHLDTLNGVLKEMGAVYREMRRSELDVATGVKLIYSLRCLRETIEGIPESDRCPVCQGVHATRIQGWI